MATRSLSKPARAPAPAIHGPGYSDDTAPRIRAYLFSVRPLRGVAGLGGSEPYQRGRSLIERLALCAHGTDAPSLRLSPAQCADVVHFVRNSEPIVRLRTWWTDPKGEPSHLVGLCFVLDAVEGSLRDGGRRS